MVTGLGSDIAALESAAIGDEVTRRMALRLIEDGIVVCAIAPGAFADLLGVPRG